MPELIDRVVDYFDGVKALAERAQRPAYAETCGCGGSVEVAQTVTRADRRRIEGAFWLRHHACTVTPDLLPGPTEQRKEQDQ